MSLWIQAWEFGFSLDKLLVPWHSCGLLCLGGSGLGTSGVLPGQPSVTVPRSEPADLRALPKEPRRPPRMLCPISCSPWSDDVTS